METVAAAGDVARAEELARSITDPYRQAEALSALATEARPARARMLVASAFRPSSDWTIPLDALVHLQPAAVMAIGDDFLKPGLPAPGSR